MAAAVSPGFEPARRFVLCDHCGAPLEVPVSAGTARCAHCGAHQQVRMRIDAALRRAPATSEPERLARLGAQDHWMAFPPPIAELSAAGRVLPSRISDALALWQKLRAAQKAGASFEVSEQLFCLSLALAERALDDRELLRQRALLESALELLELPRHQQVLRAYLSRGACRSGDVQGAESWLAPCDPASDDLPSDTAWRYARAYLDTARGDFRAVIHVLGASGADVPLWDLHEAECAVLRANAWERMGQVAFAIDLLMAQKHDVGPAARSRGRRLIALHADWQLCAHSEPQAEAAFMALTPPQSRSERNAGRLIIGGMVLYSIFGAIVGVALLTVGSLFFEDGASAGFLLALYGFLLSIILGPLWIGAMAKARSELRTRAQGRQASAQILSLVPSEGSYMPGTRTADVSVAIFPDDAPAYQLSFSLAYVEEAAHKVRVGTPLVVRLNPEDPRDLEIEQVG